MPIIFHQRDGRWDAEPVSGSPGRLSLAPVRFTASDDGAGRFPGPIVLARSDRERQWVLFVARTEHLLHNGQPVKAGMRVLAHRDSLALGGREAVYFSTEEAARIEPFAGPARSTCPRCRCEILPAQAAVKCPRCGVFHHETEERNCWTYGPTCALCAQPTAQEAGLQWTPEGL